MKNIIFLSIGLITLQTTEIMIASSVTRSEATHAINSTLGESTITEMLHLSPATTSQNVNYSAYYGENKHDLMDYYDDIIESIQEETSQNPDNLNENFDNENEDILDAEQSNTKKSNSFSIASYAYPKNKNSLHEAVIHNDKQLVTKLLAHNTNINEQSPTYNNNTPLHIALQLCHNDIAHMLLNNYAHVTIKNNNNETAFELAHKPGSCIRNDIRSKIFNKFVGPAYDFSDDESIYDEEN